MNVETNRHAAAINMMFWAVLVGLLMQAGAIFLLRQANAPRGSDIESINHLITFINF